MTALCQIDPEKLINIDKLTTKMDLFVLINLIENWIDYPTNTAVTIHIRNKAAAKYQVSFSTKSVDLAAPNI